ncbi:MAG: hypothetical protein AcusKO_29000 [Acuticoccus sp.]
MTGPIARIGLAGSAVAALTASCCVLPMVLMLFGLGGSWLAVFGKIAAAGFYVGAFALLLVVAAWILALRRGSSRSTIAILAVGSVLIAGSWLVMLNETVINDYIISLM